MGLFDTPPVSIMKRVPRECVPILSAIQVFAESLIPDTASRTTKGAILGIVLAAYVEDQAAAGNILLSSWNRAYIRTLSQNCVRIAGSSAAFASLILEELRERASEDATTEIDPLAEYPEERLMKTGSNIALAVVMAAHEAGINPEAVVKTTFFGGYVMGFTEMATDDLDGHLRLASATFSVTVAEVPSGALMSRIAYLIGSGDEQAIAGAIRGRVDGECWFSALRENRDAVGAHAELTEAISSGVIDLKDTL